MRRKALKAEKAARNNKDTRKAEEILETAMEKEIRETAQRLKKRMDMLHGKKKAQSRWKLGAKAAIGKKSDNTPALLKVTLKAVKTKNPRDDRPGSGDPLERELQLLTSRLRKTRTTPASPSAGGGVVDPMQASLEAHLKGLKKTTTRETSAAPTAGEGGLSAALVAQKAGLKKAVIGEGAAGTEERGGGEGLDPLEAALRAHMAGLKKTKVEGKGADAEKSQTVDPLEEALKQHLRTLSKVKVNKTPYKSQERSVVFAFMNIIWRESLPPSPSIHFTTPFKSSPPTMCISCLHLLPVAMARSLPRKVFFLFSISPPFLHLC